MAKIKKTGRHTSALKAARQSWRHRLRNVEQKTQIKDLNKELVKALAAKDNSKSSKLLSDLYTTIDKAAKINLLHWRTAARKKSGLARRVNQAFAAAPAAAAGQSAPAV